MIVIADKVGIKSEEKHPKEALKNSLFVILQRSEES